MDGENGDLATVAFALPFIQEEPLPGATVAVVFSLPVDDAKGEVALDGEKGNLTAVASVALELPALIFLQEGASLWKNARVVLILLAGDLKGEVTLDGEKDDFPTVAFALLLVPMVIQEGSLVGENVGVELLPVLVFVNDFAIGVVFGVAAGIVSSKVLSRLGFVFIFVQAGGPDASTVRALLAPILAFLVGDVVEGLDAAVTLQLDGEGGLRVDGKGFGESVTSSEGESVAAVSASTGEVESVPSQTTGAPLEAANAYILAILDNPGATTALSSSPRSTVDNGNAVSAVVVSVVSSFVEVVVSIIDGSLVVVFASAAILVVAGGVDESVAIWVSIGGGDNFVVDSACGLEYVLLLLLGIGEVVVATTEVWTWVVKLRSATRCRLAAMRRAK